MDSVFGLENQNRENKGQEPPKDYSGDIAAIRKELEGFKTQADSWKTDRAALEGRLTQAEARAAAAEKKGKLLDDWQRAIDDNPEYVHGEIARYTSQKRGIPAGQQGNQQGQDRGVFAQSPEYQKLQKWGEKVNKDLKELREKQAASDIKEYSANFRSALNDTVDDLKSHYGIDVSAKDLAQKLVDAGIDRPDLIRAGALGIYEPQIRAKVNGAGKLSVFGTNGFSEDALRRTMDVEALSKSKSLGDLFDNYAGQVERNFQ